MFGLRGLVLCLAVFPVWRCGLPISAAADLDQESLAKVLESREQFFSSLEVEMAFLLDGKAGRCGVLVHDGKVKCDFVSDDRHMIAIKAGGLFKQMQGSSSGWLTAKIERNETPTFPWAIDPVMFLTKVYGRPVSDFLQDSSAKIEAEDGKLVVSVDRLSDHATIDYRVKAYLHPARGYALGRVARYIRAGESEPWVPHQTVIVSGLIEYQDSGHYIPTKGEHVLYNPFGEDIFGDGGQAEGSVLASSSVEFSSWILPARVESNTFELDIPDGVNVEDRVRGLSYIKHKLGDKEIRGSLDSVNAISLENRETGWGRILFIAANVLMLVGIAGWLIVRRS